MFAFGKSYVVLLVARAIQGVGSSFASTAGISLLADRFVDDCERGKALGHAIGGLAMGVLCELFDLKQQFILFRQLLSLLLVGCYKTIFLIKNFKF